MAWMMAGAKSAPGSRLGSDGRWPHTLRRRVLAKVLSLVFAENAGGLDLGSRATGELLVEVDDTLHADSVRGSTNGLHHTVSQLLFPPFCPLPQPQPSAAPSKQPCSSSSSNAHQTLGCRCCRVQKARGTAPGAQFVRKHVPWGKRPESSMLAAFSKLFPGEGRRTLGGMSVESARRVT